MEVRRRRHLKLYEEHLKKFNYRKALDAALTVSVCMCMYVCVYHLWCVCVCVCVCVSHCEHSTRARTGSTLSTTSCKSWLGEMAW